MKMTNYYINIKYYQCYYMVCPNGLVCFICPMELNVIN